MTKVVLFMVTSLDDFIADKDGTLDWIDPYRHIEGEDYGYNAFYASIGCIVMGSHSYEKILESNHWLWPGKQTFVFTSRSLRVDCSEISLVDEDLNSFMRQLRIEKPDQTIWLLGGAELIKSFATFGLIDECVMTIIPTKLEEGIPLSLPYEDFELTQIKECKAGVVQKFYVRKESPSQG